MNSTRHAGMRTYGCGRWGPVYMYVFLPVTLYFICLVFHIWLFSTPPPKVGCDSLNSSIRFDSTVITIPGTNIHRIPCAICSGFIQMPAPGAVMALGLFSMPVDTETMDTESAVAKLAKPVFFVLSCLTRGLWHPTAARHVSTPLYLFHQSMLC